MPRYEVGLRTRAAVLSAAEQIFCERGFRTVTIVDIAKAAGCSKASVLYHFESKIDILAAIVEPIVAAYADLHDRSKRLPSSEMQDAVIDSWIGMLLHYRSAATILRRELTELSDHEALRPLWP